jgi:hypothetical protein
MFHGFYATTRDRKNNEHNYKLRQGEGVPNGHEITNLAVAGRFKFAEIVDADTAQLLKDMFPKARRAKA